MNNKKCKCEQRSKEAKRMTKLFGYLIIHDFYCEQKEINKK